MSRMEKRSETVTFKARELHVECDEYLQLKPKGKVMRHAIDIVAPCFFRTSRPNICNERSGHSTWRICKPVATPSPKGQSTGRSHEQTNIEECNTYRKTVGTLAYLSADKTRHKNRNPQMFVDRAQGSRDPSLTIDGTASNGTRVQKQQ